MEKSKLYYVALEQVQDSNPYQIFVLKTCYRFMIKALIPFSVLDYISTILLFQSIFVDFSYINFSFCYFSLCILSFAIIFIFRN